MMGYLKKIELLYQSHEEKYDEFERYVSALERHGVILPAIRDHILEKADEVVESHGTYNYALGKWAIKRWFSPMHWIFSVFDFFDRPWLDAKKKEEHG